MITIKQQLIRVLVILFSFSLLPSVRAFAVPNIQGTIGEFTENSTITINGSGFGNNGPNVVIFDNFEGGQNGSIIKTGPGSATVGKWDNVWGNLPRYDNQYSVSGSQAFKADFTKQTSSGLDASSWAKVDNLNTWDVFLSYWVMLPTTSSFPCNNYTNCNNWKVVWLWGQNARDDDQVIPVILGGFNGQDAKSGGLRGEVTMSCNDCGSTPSPYWHLNMVKGKWYRIWAWVHGTADGTSRRDFWMLSTDESRPVTTYVKNYTGKVIGPDNQYDPPKYFQSFVLAPWARLCQPCTESAPRYDDVYVATGANGRARVVIGNAPVYTDCTNLALLTPSSWSENEITATVRKGSFKDGAAYLFVFDASGNPSDGFEITLPPIPYFLHASRVIADPAYVIIEWIPYPNAKKYRLERQIIGKAPTVVVDNTAKTKYKDYNPTLLGTNYTLYPLNDLGQELTPGLGPAYCPEMK